MVITGIIDMSMSMLSHLNFRLSSLKLGNLGSVIAHLPFLPLAILIEYLIENVTSELLWVKFMFSTRIFYMGGPGFATD